MIHEGNLIIEKNDKRDFSKLYKVTGDIYLHANAKLTAPLLATSGNISLHENTKLTAPLLATSGYISLHENTKLTAPLLDTSGSISLHENAKLTAPLLATSGYIYLHENAKLTAPLLATSGSICLSENAKIETSKTKRLNYKSIDNLMFVTENEKVVNGIKILSGYNVLSFTKTGIEKQNCFVAEKDNFFAHGKTVKKAIEDLRFKVISETLKNQPITKDTVININYYRLITGACELGVKSWMNANNMTKTEYKAYELLPILKQTNAYGLERFKKLITF